MSGIYHDNKGKLKYIDLVHHEITGGYPYVNEDFFGPDTWLMMYKTKQFRKLDDMHFPIQTICRDKIGYD